MAELDLTYVLLPDEQVNLSGKWTPIPVVADHADNLKDLPSGVETTDEDSTYLFTSATGRYTTLQLLNIPLTNGITTSTPIKTIRLAFVGMWDDNTGAGNPVVNFRLFISGQQATPAFKVDFSTNFTIDIWTAVNNETAGGSLLAPWTSMTVGDWNDENDAGPPGCRLQFISDWTSSDGGDSKPYTPPAIPLGYV